MPKESQNVNQPPAPDRVRSWLAKALIVIALLNLNGLFYMLIDVSQLFSLPLLIFSIALLLRCGRLRVDLQMALFLIFLGAYLAFGLLFIPIYSDSRADPLLAIDVMGTFLLTLALAAHIQQSRSPEELFDFLRFVRNVAVLSALATLASPLLYQIYANAPPSEDYRNAGIFLNPNETGLMCMLAYIMTTVVPFGKRPIQYLIAGLILVSAVVTFSRSAILAILVMLLVSIFQASRWIRLVMIPSVGALIVVILTNPMSLVDLIRHQGIINLGEQQIDRLTTTVLAATGQIDSRTSNSRTDMVQISFEKAMEIFPFGKGLNTFHHISGGIMGADDWLGSHNLYLMAWGESGFLVFAILVAFTIVMFARGLRSIAPWVSLYLVLLFLTSALTSHDTLSARFMNVVIALILGLTTVPEWGVDQRREPIALPA